MSAVQLFQCWRLHLLWFLESNYWVKTLRRLSCAKKSWYSCSRFGCGILQTYFHNVADSQRLCLCHERHCPTIVHRLETITAYETIKHTYQILTPHCALNRGSWLILMLSSCYNNTTRGVPRMNQKYGKVQTKLFRCKASVVDAIYSKYSHR